MTLLFQIMRPGGYLLWTMRDGYQAKSQRFALMDAELNDITSSGQAEMVSWQGLGNFVEEILKHEPSLSSG